MSNEMIQTFTLVHADHRRIISEVNGPDYSVQRFEILGTVPLGNHYHEHKTETFIITKAAANW